MVRMLRKLTITIPLLLVLAGCISSPNVITWETASEVDTGGFNLYRGLAEDGPWVLVNEALIPPATDPLRGGSYEFTDTAADPGVTYYYMLEEVELNGATTQYPPTLLESESGLPDWPWWIAGAVGTIIVGWWLGSRIQRKGTASEA